MYEEMDDVEQMLAKYKEEQIANVKQLKETIQQGKATSVTYVELGMGLISLDKLKNKAEAQELYNKAFALAQNELRLAKDDFEKIDALYSMHCYYKYNKNNKDALRCLDEMVKLSPDALLSRAFFKSEVLSDKKGAQADLNLALSKGVSAEEVDLMKSVISNNSFLTKLSIFDARSIILIIGAVILFLITILH